MSKEYIHTHRYKYIIFMDTLHKEWYHIRNLTLIRRGHCLYFQVFPFRMHHFIVCGFNERETQAEHKSAFISLCYIPSQAMWLATFHSHHFIFLAMMDFTVEILIKASLSFLELLLLRYFVSEMRRVTNATFIRDISLWFPFTAELFSCLSSHTSEQENLNLNVFPVWRTFKNTVPISFSLNTEYKSIVKALHPKFFSDICFLFFILSV